MLRLRSYLPVLIALLAGCGGVKPVPTKGIVLYNGKPLPNASVMFLTQDPKGRDATGYTDADGAFELTTFQVKDGALPGEYKITVNYSEAIKPPPGATGPSAIQQASTDPSRKTITLSPKYSKADQTILKHKVPDDGDARLELRSGGP